MGSKQGGFFFLCFEGQKIKFPQSLSTPDGYSFYPFIQPARVRWGIFSHLSFKGGISGQAQVEHVPTSSRVHDYICHFYFPSTGAVRHQKPSCPGILGGNGGAPGGMSSPVSLQNT